MDCWICWNLEWRRTSFTHPPPKKLNQSCFRVENPPGFWKNEQIADSQSRMEIVSLKIYWAFPFQTYRSPQYALRNSFFLPLSPTTRVINLLWLKFKRELNHKCSLQTVEGSLAIGILLVTFERLVESDGQIVWSFFLYYYYCLKISICHHLSRSRGLSLPN